MPGLPGHVCCGQGAWIPIFPFVGAPRGRDQPSLRGADGDVPARGF